MAEQWICYYLIITALLTFVFLLTFQAEYREEGVGYEGQNLDGHFGA